MALIHSVLVRIPLSNERITSESVQCGWAFGVSIVHVKVCVCVCSVCVVCVYM